MPKTYRFGFSSDDIEAADRQTASLAGLAVSLTVLVVCLFLMNELHHKAVIEDCLLSGRLNCDMLVNQFR
jgi:hypothetical protein